MNRASRFLHDRPAGSGKEQIAIRFDKDVLAGLRATGKGWQTRINEVMREWLKQQA
ncbi:MAG: BrnA antitoxin family protein [Oxalobacter formigenes]|nr:BrnA antitoxin family protein [Oxalobacter formigenes]